MYREEGRDVCTDCGGEEHRPSSNFITEKAGSDGNDKVVNIEDTILSKMLRPFTDMREVVTHNEKLSVRIGNWRVKWIRKRGTTREQGGSLPIPLRTLFISTRVLESLWITYGIVLTIRAI